MKSGQDWLSDIEDVERSQVQVAASVAISFREVHDVFRRLMGYENVSVVRDRRIACGKSAGDGGLHRQRDAVEFKSLYHYGVVAEIVAVGVKLIRFASVQAEVVAVGYEHLVGIQQVTEPFHEIKRLLSAPPLIVMSPEWTMISASGKIF